MTQARDLGNIGDTLAGVSNVNIDSGTLFVDAANNRVGVGTTAPGYLFEVRADSNTQTAWITSTNRGSTGTAFGAGYLAVANNTSYTAMGHGGTGNFTLENATSGNVSIRIAGGDRIIATSGGPVLLPSQPSFHVTHSNNTLSTGAIVWGNVTFNIGNYYNVSNGRFTAPVAGTYFFRAQTLIQNAPGGETRIALYKNDAGYGGLRFITQKPANAWFSIIVHGHIYMAANEWVTVVMETNPTTIYSDATYNSFSGHLVG